MGSASFSSRAVRGAERKAATPQRAALHVTRREAKWKFNENEILHIANNANRG